MVCRHVSQLPANEKRLTDYRLPCSPFESLPHPESLRLRPATELAADPWESSPRGEPWESGIDIWAGFWSEVCKKTSRTVSTGRSSPSMTTCRRIMYSGMTELPLLLEEVVLDGGES